GVEAGQRVGRVGDAGADAAEVHRNGLVAQMGGRALEVAHVPTRAGREDCKTHAPQTKEALQPPSPRTAVRGLRLPRLGTAQLIKRPPQHLRLRAPERMALAAGEVMK